MKLHCYPESKLKQEILSAVGRHVDLRRYHVFIFGSRAGRTAHERSDVDVGIEGPGPIPAEAFLEIQEEMEHLPTLYRVDVVDFARVDDRFRRVAKQQIERLN